MSKKVKNQEVQKQEVKKQEVKKQEVQKQEVKKLSSEVVAFCNSYKVGSVALNGTAIVNPEMAYNVDVMNKALIAGNLAGWKFAVAVNDIVTGELFKEDFNTLKQFSEVARVTAGFISQTKKAVSFAREHGIDTTNPNITPSKVYEVARLSKESFNDLMNMLTRNGYTLSYFIAHSTVKQIREHDLEKRRQKALEAEFKEDLQEDKEEKASAEIIEIDYNGNVYRIPSNILEKYRVKEEKK